MIALRNKILIIVYLILFIITIVSCDTSTDYQVEPLPIEKNNLPEILVAQLSGKLPIYGNILLSDRWTPQSRKRIRKYLKEIIKQLDIVASEHRYRFANNNFGIDLIINPFKGTNIYGILPATIKTNEYIILGAHYDTGKRNAPGAIDNASGVALVYTTIKEVKQLNYRSKNILFVFFDQEEEENIGSKAFIELIKKKNWNIHSVHCFDMVGWDRDQDKLFEFYTISKPILKLYKNIALKNNISLHTTFINRKNFKRSATDFDEFAKAGYPSIGGGDCFYKNDISKHKDSKYDTYETVNFKYLQLGTDFIIQVITALLNR